ncbi:hypothetical protein NKH77_45805 [Streptomyces sp. M19]
MDDDIRYVVTRQDRRKLYFEALSCSPLTRAHYDEEVVTMLSGEELDRVSRADGYPRFTPIPVRSGFDRTALRRLRDREDRARFNLPVAMDALDSVGEELVFLPVYLVRGRAGLLVYGQTGAGREHDPELSDLCDRAPELISALDNEEAAEERTSASSGPPATGSASGAWTRSLRSGTTTAPGRSRCPPPPSARRDSPFPASAHTAWRATTSSACGVRTTHSASSPCWNVWTSGWARGDR